MAKRYDQKTKDEVVSFIKAFNDEQGRGGQAAAAKKWDLNPITVKTWMEKAGVKSPGKTAKKKKAGKRGKRGRPAARPTAAVAAPKAKAAVTQKSASANLRRMLQLQEKIEAYQAEYDAIKRSL